MHRAVLGLLVAAVLPTLAGAEILRVPSDHPSLTAAVRAAGPDDQVEVGPGTFSPSVSGEEFPIVLDGRNLVIRGAGAGRTVLDAEGGSHLFTFRAGDASRLAGFTLTGGRAEVGAAVRIAGASPDLERLHFTGHEADVAGDVLVVLGGDPRVANCLFDGNGPRGPTVLIRAGIPTLEYNSLHANGGAAFELHPDASPILRATIVSRPGEPGGTAVGMRVLTGDGLGSPILEDNLFAGCLDGTVVIVGERGDDILDGLREDARRADGLREGDPLFVDPEAGDFRLLDGSPARRFLDPGAQIGAYGGPDPLRLDPVRATLREDGAETEEGLLGPSVPNPFTPATTIQFTVKESGVVDLGIYNVLGQRVRNLITADLAAGEYSRVWDGRDDVGTDLPPGIYFVRVTQGEITESLRLVLVR